MSAWIVSKRHIDLLVGAGIALGTVEADQADEVGTELWRENYRSVNYLYGERARTPSYTFVPWEEPVSFFDTWAQLQCYEYQACERPDFVRSKASRFVVELDQVLLEKLGFENHEQAHEDQRWNHAPWGV